jgi:hypothetical protein
VPPGRRVAAVKQALQGYEVSRRLVHISIEPVSAASASQ